MDVSHTRIFLLLLSIITSSSSTIIENPHVIQDIFNYMPGTTYSSLSRIVRSAWHMARDPVRVEMQSRMTPGLSEQGMWMTGWRSQFMVGIERNASQCSKICLRRVDWKLCNKTCVHVQCTMETWLGPLMNCAPHLFAGDNCTKHTHNLALPAVEADFNKDGLFGHGGDTLATKTTQTVCGDRTILYAENFYNGMFFCGEGDYSSARAWLDTVAVPAEQNKDTAELLKKFQAARKKKRKAIERLKKLQEEEESFKKLQEEESKGLEDVYLKILVEIRRVVHRSSDLAFAPLCYAC
jgi:hypothetical protein